MKCKTCDNILYKHNKTGFCKECYQEKRTKNKKFFRCIDCNNIIKNSKSPRCKKCSIKIVIQKNSKQILTKCNICNKEISFKKSAFERSQNHYCSKECYGKNLSTKSSAMLGKHHTEEAKKKMSNTTKGNHNYPKTEFKKGKLHPNWRGGISEKSYPLGWTKTFKEQIRYRDGYKCQLCGCHEVECKENLSIHHIDFNKQNLDEYNLISLCRGCHSKTTINRTILIIMEKIK